MAQYHKFSKSFKVPNLKDRKKQTNSICLLGSKMRCCILKKGIVSTWQGYIFSGIEDHKGTKQFSSIIFLSLFFGSRGGPPNLQLDLEP